MEVVLQEVLFVQVQIKQTLICVPVIFTIQGGLQDKIEHILIKSSIINLCKKT